MSLSDAYHIRDTDWRSQIIVYTHQSIPHVSPAKHVQVGIKGESSDKRDYIILEFCYTCRTETVYGKTVKNFER